MNKIYVLLLLLAIPFVKVDGQVKGLSASKLVALSASTVALNHLEFEPSFSFFRAENRWNSYGKKEQLYQSADSVLLSKELGFRFTYGLGEKTEIGSYICSDAGTVAISAKHRFVEKTGLMVAAFGGGSLYTSNEIYERNVCSEENGMATSLGAVSSFSISPKWSSDADFQVQQIFNDHWNSRCFGLFSNVDVSYRPKESLQLIASFNYFYGKKKDEKYTVNRFSITPGITIETASQFIVVVSFPNDVLGRNMEAFKGISFALTIMLN